MGVMIQGEGMVGCMKDCTAACGDGYSSRLPSVRAEDLFVRGNGCKNLS